MWKIIEALDRFVKTTIGAAAVTLLLTTLAGGYITYRFACMQTRANMEAEARKASAENRSELINNITKLLSDRKVHAGLVISAMRHGADDKEVEDRWAAYQTAYIGYNTSLYRYKAATGLLLGIEVGGKLNSSFDTYITRGFQLIDVCLTDAYYAYTVGKDRSKAVIKLNQCYSKKKDTYFKIDDEMNLLQSCIGTYDDVLMRSVFIENEFDKLPNRPVAGDTEALKSDPNGVELSCQKSDFVCKRVASAGGITKEIATGCAPVIAFKGFKLPQAPAETKPSPGN